MARILFGAGVVATALPLPLGLPLVVAGSWPLVGLPWPPPPPPPQALSRISVSDITIRTERGPRLFKSPASELAVAFPFFWLQLLWLLVH